MLTIEKVDTNSSRQVHRFVQFHYDLYKGTPQWVPPFYSDIKMMLNRKKHPFFEHSDGDFYIAVRGKEVVGRIAIIENRPYNQAHNCKKAQFYLFDTINDLDVARALFDQAQEWAKARGLDAIVGPKGLGPFDGYGILVDGFQHRQMMIMMNYNFDYYPKLMDSLGYEKEVDFVSNYISRDRFYLPEKIMEVARRVEERGTFQVLRFKNKKELVAWADRIGEAYNKTFVNNWEYYPLTKHEIDFALNNVLSVAVPDLIKIITHQDEVVGFLLGFPDISASLQRHGGHITPWGIADMLIDLKRSKFICLNGVGVLPEYQGRGANALLYAEMAKIVMNYNYIEGELTQLADTATQVRKDLVTAGTTTWKIHRVYHKSI